MITPEQFHEWKNHPVTKEIFVELKKTRQLLIDRLVIGSTIGDTAEITHGSTSRLVGHIDGLNQLLHISFENEANVATVDEVSGY